MTKRHLRGDKRAHTGQAEGQEKVHLYLCLPNPDKEYQIASGPSELSIYSQNKSSPITYIINSNYEDGPVILYCMRSLILLKEISSSNWFSGIAHAPLRSDHIFPQSNSF